MWLWCLSSVGSGLSQAMSDVLVAKRLTELGKSQDFPQESIPFPAQGVARYQGVTFFRVPMFFWCWCLCRYNATDDEQWYGKV